MAPSKTSARGGIDLPTLAITAAASAGAAYTCSKIWAPGTLASAAFMPVLVALLKEALARPTYAVTRAVPVRGAVRSATHPGQPPEAVTERVAQPGEIPGQSGSRRARGWQMAIVTGLLGFLVCAVIITVPELVAGKAASGGGGETTLFGGQERSPEPSTPTDTTTTTTPAETVTVPPAKTLTAPAPRSTTTEPPPQATTEPTTPTTTAPALQTTTSPPAAPPPPG